MTFGHTWIYQGFRGSHSVRYADEHGEWSCCELNNCRLVTATLCRVAFCERQRLRLFPFWSFFQYLVVFSEGRLAASLDQSSVYSEAEQKSLPCLPSRCARRIAIERKSPNAFIIVICQVTHAILISANGSSIQRNYYAGNSACVWCCWQFYRFVNYFSWQT